jgi:recombination associated protein RdgC
MFKNAILYRIRAGLPGSSEQFGQWLAREAFLPCGPSQAKSGGWVPPRGHAHGALIEAVNGQWIARYVIETKNVPAAEVDRKLQEAIDHLDKTTGHKPGKKEGRDLRDEALLALLPRAFARQSAVWLWIDPRDGLLVLDATGQCKADEAIASLVRVLGQGLQIGYVQTLYGPMASMAAWLADEDDASLPKALAIGRECELKGAGDEPARVRFDHHSLDIDEVRRHVNENKLPVRLALSWQGSVSFMLTHQLQLRCIRFMEGWFDKREAATGEDRFDADVTIITGGLRPLIDDLIGALGGEAKDAHPS